MNKLFVAVALSLCVGSVMAQNNKKDKKPTEGFVFKTVTESKITDVKNQSRSSTCWSFSSNGFLEAELLRLGRGNFDLSEMFIVHKTMQDRAVNYVRYHGDSSFSPGGSFYDAVYCYQNYGMVPKSVMPGIMYGDTIHNHTELDAVAEGYVKVLVKSNPRKLSPTWKKGLAAIYDAYLGECPKEFTYEGKRYTPRTFADEVLRLNMDDYVSLTSFTHHPFYTSFAIEVPDNWRNALSYNLPLNEFMEVMENAVNNGYTFAWGADVSEEGFTRDGIAVSPDASNTSDLTGSDMARWLKLSKAEQNKELTKRPSPEIKVTQEMRQEAYDNWQTTDDHGMLIYGLAKDQNGKEYFMMKNSWGKTGKYKGLWYVSKAFVAYKTMNILVHKDAIPTAIAQKLGLK